MIYFDCAATCPPFPKTLEVFAEASALAFANSSSRHGAGQKSARMLEKARTDVLDCLNVKESHRCLFLSGATEANNLAIKGVAFNYANRGKKIITSAVEHPSVLNAFRQLKEKFGYEVVELPVTKDGVVDPEALKAAMDKNVILVSIMAVNNETGAINDIGALADIVHAFPKAFFHSDVTQAIGKVRLPFQKIDLFSFSAHKFGGLRGNGCLIVKKSIKLLSLSSGGEQEFGERAGTVDVPGTVALAFALNESLSTFDARKQKMAELRAYLWEKLSQIDEISFNSPKEGSPYLLNFSLNKHKASVIVEGLSEKEIYVSSVSACSSKGEPISHVLLAMGKSEGEAANSIRLSPKETASKEDCDVFIDALKELLAGVMPR